MCQHIWSQVYITYVYVRQNYYDEISSSWHYPNVKFWLVFNDNSTQSTFRAVGFPADIILHPNKVLGYEPISTYSHAYFKIFRTLKDVLKVPILWANDNQTTETCSYWLYSWWFRIANKDSIEIIVMERYELELQFSVSAKIWESF